MFNASDGKFNRIGSLAIAGAIGVAGIILGLGIGLGIGSDSPPEIVSAPIEAPITTRHIIVEQYHLTQDQIRHHEIRFDATTRECVVYDKAPNGDTLTIIVPNAMPTYEQKWGNPKGTIIECETRD